MEDSKNLNTAVETWWNDHPFTCGIGSTKAHDLTGKVDVLDREFFDALDRRMHKWWDGATQEAGMPLLSKLVPYGALSGKNILDIAVGTGWSSILMAQHGAQVTGIDLTDEAIRMSQRHAELKGVTTAHFEKMDAQQLVFPDQTFDFVLAWGCHMHMPDTERSLREVARTLKPGGMTVAYWYNKSSWTYWFNFLFLRGILLGKLITYRGNTTKLVSRYTDGAATGGNALTKVYTPEVLEHMYRDAGFSSVWTKTLPLRGEVEGWPFAKFPIFRFLPKSWRNWMGKQ